MFRKALESGLECENIKSYVKVIGKDKIKDIIDKMKNDYDAADEKEKELIEYRLNDIINEMSSYSIISAFMGIMISICFTLKFNLVETLCMLGIILFMFLYVISLILRYYRCCKMYLMVIENSKKK